MSPADLAAAPGLALCAAGVASERTPYRPYGSGWYRRELEVRCEAGRAVGELVDDFHHFRATLDHDGSFVTRAVGEAIRYPWTSCGGAALPLQQLVGLPLSSSLRAPARFARWREQCTHLFDAAALAVVAAARGLRERRWAIAIPDREQGRTRATLACDAAPLLSWDVDAGVISAAPPFGGRRLVSGFADWAETELEPDLALCALLLQRALVISMGRGMDLELAERATSLSTRPMGQCHTYQPGTAEHALRMLGSVRNWDAASDLSAEFGKPAPPPAREEEPA
jgi:hypothetical protein